MRAQLIDLNQSRSREEGQQSRVTDQVTRPRESAQQTEVVEAVVGVGGC